MGGTRGCVRLRSAMDRAFLSKKITLILGAIRAEHTKLLGVQLQVSRQQLANICLVNLQRTIYDAKVRPHYRKDPLSNRRNDAGALHRPGAHGVIDSYASACD